MSDQAFLRDRERERERRRVAYPWLVLFLIALFVGLCIFLIVFFIVHRPATSAPTASPTGVPTTGAPTAVIITGAPTSAPTTRAPTLGGQTFAPTLAPTAAPPTAAPTVSSFCGGFGTAGCYGALAGTVLNGGAAVGTVIVGDIGATGGPITNFPPGLFTGTNYGVAGATNGAAFGQATAADICIGTISPCVDRTADVDLTGETLGPGCYNFPSAAVLTTGALTLAGNSTDIFVFRIGTTFTQAASTQIILSGGALYSNVYWKIGTQLILGATATFQGTVVAGTDILIGANSNLFGSLVAGALITLNQNTVVSTYTCP